MPCSSREKGPVLKLDSGEPDPFYSAQPWESREEGAHTPWGDSPGDLDG